MNYIIKEDGTLVFKVGDYKGLSVEFRDEDGKNIRGNKVYYFKEVTDVEANISQIQGYRVCKVEDLTLSKLSKYRRVRITYAKVERVVVYYRYGDLVKHSEDYIGDEGKTLEVVLEDKGFWIPESKKLKIKFNKSKGVYVNYSHIDSLLEDINDKLLELNKELKSYESIKRGGILEDEY